MVSETCHSSYDTISVTVVNGLNLIVHYIYIFYEILNHLAFWKGVVIRIMFDFLCSNYATVKNLFNSFLIHWDFSNKSNDLLNIFHINSFAHFEFFLPVYLLNIV